MKSNEIKVDKKKGRSADSSAQTRRHMSIGVWGTRQQRIDPHPLLKTLIRDGALTAVLLRFASSRWPSCRSASACVCWSGIPICSFCCYSFHSFPQRQLQQQLRSFSVSLARCFVRLFPLPLLWPLVFIVEARRFSRKMFSFFAFSWIPSIFRCLFLFSLSIFFPPFEISRIALRRRIRPKCPCPLSFLFFIRRYEHICMYERVPCLHEQWVCVIPYRYTRKHVMYTMWQNVYIHNYIYNEESN